MDDALASVAAGMNALERRLDVAAHNLANARTPGFIPRLISVRSFDAEYGDALGGGLVKSEEGLSFQPGQLVPSSNPLAVGLRGEGFFELETPDGPVYTRGGDFDVVDGRLATRAGYAVQGEGGTIRLTPEGGPARIDARGNVLQGGSPVGRLRTVRFANEAVLEAVSETCVRRRADSTVAAEAVAAPEFAPGMVEVPAAGAVEGLVEMITVHRGFDAAQRASYAIHEAYERILRPQG
jgi:flagellar basal-body rod protein FlgF